MSFLQKQLFKLTYDPESEKAYAEKVADDRAAREQLAATMQATIDRVKRGAASYLPDDVKYITDELQRRITEVRSSTLDRAACTVYLDSVDMQNIALLEATLADRYAFKSRMTRDAEFLSKSRANLVEKKYDVPPAFDAYDAVVAEMLTWFEKTRFAEKTVYTAKLDDYTARLAEIKTKYGVSGLDTLETTTISAQEAERETFDVARMGGQALGIVGIVVGVFLLVVLGLLGASLASNLNVYKPAGYRILYAIYGFVFFFIVIPYVFGYRWFWLGKKPQFYAVIPLVPYKFENRYAALLLSWMSYRPEDSIARLKEWETAK